MFPDAVSAYIAPARTTGGPPAVPEAPTIYEVARAAGVSIATVSRALTDASKLRPETRERVLQVVAELGYVPSGLAQGMARRRTGVLGLAFPDLADPSVDEGHETLLYYDAVLRGVERAARRDGYAVLIAATEGVEDRDFDVSWPARRTAGVGRIQSRSARRTQSCWRSKAAALSWSTGKKAGHAT